MSCEPRPRRPVNGPLVEQVLSVVGSFDAALDCALAMALRAQRVAWCHVAGDDFEPLSRESARHAPAVDPIVRTNRSS